MEGEGQRRDRNEGKGGSNKCLFPFHRFLQFYSSTPLMVLDPITTLWGVRFFSTNKQFFVTPAGCATIQLNSDTVYQEIATNSTGQGLTPPSQPSPPTSDTSCKLRLSLMFLTDWLQIRGSNHTLLGFY